MNRQHKLGIAVVLACMLVCSGIRVATQEPGVSGVVARPKPKIGRVPSDQPLPVSPPQASEGGQPPPASGNPPPSNPGPANPAPSNHPPSNPEPSGPGHSNLEPSNSGPSAPESSRPDRPPPQLPPSAVPQSAPQGQPQGGRASAPTDMAAQVLINKVGIQRVQKIFDSVQGSIRLKDASGQGAPSADVYFDGARLRSGDDEITPGEQTHFFQGGRGSTPVQVDAIYKPTTHEDTIGLANTYGSQPGGVVLEGQADVGPIDNIVYDSRFNALVLDDRGVYFLKIAPSSTAELCRAIAQQHQIGVSVGKVHISYGSLPKTTRVALDLMLADNFLGDIAFGIKKWTAGYIREWIRAAAVSRSLSRRRILPLQRVSISSRAAGVYGGAGEFHRPVRSAVERGCVRRRRGCR